MRKSLTSNPMPLLRGLTGLVLALMGLAGVYAIWIAVLNWDHIKV